MEKFLTAKSLFSVTLDLSNNFLDGQIPVSLGTLVNLQDMTLNNNLMTGDIPSSLSNLSSLSK